MKSLVFAVWLLPMAAPTTQPVRLDPADIARPSLTPVAWETDRPDAAKLLSVTFGEATTAVQAESLGDSTTRLWWYAGPLAAGKPVEQTLSTAKTKSGGFEWQTGSGHTDELRLDGKPVLVYQRAPFNPAAIEETKKPFHQVFDPSGKTLLTKGTGGLYPHHRGIYFGYSKCHVGDEVLDTWHAHKGEHQNHVETVAQWAGPVFGGHTVAIDWNNRQGRLFVRERRTVRVFRTGTEGTELLIDLVTTLSAVDRPVRLDGDRQHAGVQFRAAQAVADNQKQTRYLRPAKWSQLAADKEYNGNDFVNLPWNALQFPLEGRTFTIAYLSAPTNPKPAEFSERLYGRFGEFIPYQLTTEQPLTLRYRWWIIDGTVSREQIDQRYADFAEPVAVSAN